ncbi:MAG: shikimate dehydrogenase [Polaromonas sp.]
MIDGNTQIIAHIGYPTHAFKSPMIYNPWLEKAGVNAVVVPMACKALDYTDFLPALFKLANLRGALITMPHKAVTMGLMDVVSPTARIAGACNAVRLNSQGQLQGDMFDGDGFVRGLLRKGVTLKGAKALVVGSGGVGCAIAASLAACCVAELGLFDVSSVASEGLAARLLQHYPNLKVSTASSDPAGFDVVVNATPMGMNEGDAMPMDTSRIASSAFVGEVVMRLEMTAFLQAAKARGCAVQVGTDMLFEQIPAYLEFFGLPSTTPEELRSLARLTQ